MNRPKIKNGIITLRPEVSYTTDEIRQILKFGVHTKALSEDSSSMEIFKYLEGISALLMQVHQFPSFNLYEEDVANKLFYKKIV